MDPASIAEAVWEVLVEWGVSTLLCYAKALTQTMKGTKQIEDTKGGEPKLKQCNSPKFLPFLQVPVSLLLYGAGPIFYIPKIPLV
jgi:hypothetical protein